MANIVYGAPYLPPASQAPSWTGLAMRWVAKGTEWSLTNPETGLGIMKGIRGLGSVAGQRHSSSSPAAPGSRHEGTSTLDREVFWPICIWSDGGSLGWMERDRAFWRTMDPQDTGEWIVTLPDGGERSLTCRFLSDGGKPSEHDPMFRGWDTYGITLVAEQPYWVGEPVVNSFIGPADPLPFFGTDGPVVNIATSYSAANARMDNPGDVESYPRWFIDGPVTAAHVGVGGVVVDVPFAVEVGTCLVIESDPDSIGATLYTVTAEGAAKKPSERIVGVDLVSPVDMSPDLGEADFAPIPPGQQVPLSLEITGTGAVEVLLPTLYRRAW